MSFRLDVSLIQDVEPGFSRILESEIAVDGCALGWHAVALGSRGEVLGGGLGVRRDVARQIAVSEVLERGVFRRLSASQFDRFRFCLDRFPTSCGFAGGFDGETARQRSLFEAVERWARCLWIDEGYALTELSGIPRNLSDLGLFFSGHFEKVRYFAREFRAAVSEGSAPLDLMLGVVLGYSEDGVFPGARVCLKGEAPWEHAALEAWRHLLIFRNSERQVSANRYLPRILFFGENSAVADDVIANSRNVDWPSAQVSVQERISALDDRFTVWRTLLAGYRSWDVGGPERFVY